MPLRIMVSRDSVFYSPLIATIAAGFLERHGLAAEYGILAKGQLSRPDSRKFRGHHAVSSVVELETG